MTYRITTKGFDEAKRRLSVLPGAIAKAEVAAVNTTTRFAYAEASRGIRKQINVTQPYVGTYDNGNRLKVVQRARASNATSVIRASKRATSLARFANDRTVTRRKGGVRVTVQPGRSRLIASAFLLRLKKGASLNEDNYNIGLALRLKKGDVVRNKNRMVAYGGGDPNLYLLYGPAVYQVFREVSGKIEPDVSDFLQTEFLRQFARFARG